MSEDLTNWLGDGLTQVSFFTCRNYALLPLDVTGARDATLDLFLQK
jgi:hypothetical protein